MGLSRSFAAEGIWRIPCHRLVCGDALSPLACDGVSLEWLAKKYGTPLYVYSAGQILHRLSLFAKAFESMPHLICYSVKANSALAILKLLDQNGAGFDIVSGG